MAANPMRKKTRATRRATPRINSASLAKQVYDKIRDEILACVLEPGQQVTQAQLVDKFKVGVTPVREALQRLAQEGLVQSIPRFGYIVSPITSSDISSLYEFRGILEAAAIRLAAVRASDEQLCKIARMADFTYTFRDRQSYTDVLNHNADFHLAIALAAGNARLVGAISATLSELRRVFHLGLDLRDITQEIRQERVALIEALQSRDADRAEQILLAQNANSEERVREALLLKGSVSNPTNSIARDILASQSSTRSDSIIR
jgi:DNA-binding GntR family transcriptional regulator